MSYVVDADILQKNALNNIILLYLSPCLKDMNSELNTTVTEKIYSLS